MSTVGQPVPESISSGLTSRDKGRRTSDAPLPNSILIRAAVGREQRQEGRWALRGLLSAQRPPASSTPGAWPGTGPVR